jgi:hypothetical protein
MPRHKEPQPSILVNAAAWLLLFIIALAAGVALFANTGTTLQSLKIVKVDLHTTSTAVIVMIDSAAVLWLVLRYARQEKIRLYDASSAPWIETNAQALQLCALIIGLAGICFLIWNIIGK